MGHCFYENTEMEEGKVGGSSFFFGMWNMRRGKKQVGGKLWKPVNVRPKNLDFLLEVVRSH